MRSRQQSGPQTRPNTRLQGPHSLGRWGESSAAEYLLGQGWTILERNYRFGRREVDLVGRRGRLVAFVEVKTRAGGKYGAPEDAVTSLKRREIELVAQQYLSSRGLDDVDVRFDVVAITVGPRGRILQVRHLEDAWRPEPRR